MSDKYNDTSLTIIETVLEHSQKEPSEENLDHLIGVVSELIDDGVKRTQNQL